MSTPSREIDFDALRRIAEAATPGPYAVSHRTGKTREELAELVANGGPEDPSGLGWDYADDYPVPEPRLRGEFLRWEDANFRATFTPETILLILDTLCALAKVISDDVHPEFLPDGIVVEKRGE